MKKMSTWQRMAPRVRPRGSDHTEYTEATGNLIAGQDGSWRTGVAVVAHDAASTDDQSRAVEHGESAGPRWRDATH